MSVFLLWFSIFSFSVFLLSVLPASLRWRQRGRRSEDLLYLWLMISYCVWLIIFSVLYFSDAFISPLPGSIRTSFGLLRTAVTAVVIVLITLLSKSTAGIESGLKYKIMVFLVPAVYIALVIPVLVGSSAIFAVIVTLLYNIYIFSLAAYTLIRIGKKTDVLNIRNYFFRLIGIYCLSGILIIVLPLGGIAIESKMFLSVFPRAAFCLAWGILELIVFIKREYRKELEAGEHISSVFISDFGITGREKDVIKCISEGLSNKDTAEKLFISEKTVETHIYSIYRKCRVKNKVELLNLIRSCL